MEYYNEPCAVLEMPEPFECVEVAFQDKDIFGEDFQPGEYTFVITDVETQICGGVGGYDYSCNIDAVATSIAGGVLAASCIEDDDVSACALCLMRECILYSMLHNFEPADLDEIRMTIMQWEDPVIIELADEIIELSHR